MKPMMKFCLCLQKLSELWNWFSPVPMGNCFRCYFRQLSMYLSLRKCKNDKRNLRIILVPDFCPLKPEIAQFSIEFRLNMYTSALYFQKLQGSQFRCQHVCPDVSVHTRRRKISCSHQFKHWFCSGTVEFGQLSFTIQLYYLFDLFHAYQR